MNNLLQLIRNPYKHANIGSALLLALLFACSHPAEDQNVATDESQSEKVEDKPQEKTNRATVLLISHSISDFDLWRKGFDEHESIRQLFKLDVQQIFRCMDDTNRVVVMLTINDMETARQYVASSELADKMEEHGVVGEPEFIFLKSQRQFAKLDNEYCLLINHKVKDFEEWENGFELYNSERAEYEINVLEVYSHNEDVNNVTILFEVTNMKSAKQYAASNKIMEVMEAYGVYGAIEMNFLKVIR